MKHIALVLLVAVLTGTGAHAAPVTKSTQTARIADKVTRARVGGIDLVAYPTAVEEVVTLVGTLPAGDAFAVDSNTAVPTLVGMMLDRGTQKRDQFAIARELEEAGAVVDYQVDSQMMTVQARFLRRDLPMVIRLIAEQLRTPAFASAEFEKARQQFIGGLQMMGEDTSYRAGEAFNRAVYPVGHPNRQATLEQLLADAKKATVEQAKQFHVKYYGPAHMTLIVVGDLDVPALQSEVGSAFNGWSGGSDVLKASAPAKQIDARTEPVNLPEKTSVSVLLGQTTGLRYSDADTMALRMGAAILGSGFTGRLMSSVRDKQGLTYSIGVAFLDDTFNDGSWVVNASFAPQLLDKGIAATRREVELWRDQGITAQELAIRKQSVVGSYQVGLATTGGLARALLATIQRGHDLAWLDRYPAVIESITLEQINRVIRERVDPSKLVVVTAGTLPKS